MLTDETRARDFPWLTGRTYLNTAAEGIPPRGVIDALHQYAEDRKLGMESRALHEAQWAAAKEQIACAMGLSADEVSICSCSSDAYNLAAQALRLREGDEVVINDLDFPSGVTPWLHPSCPATVKIWRSRQFALHIEDLIPLLSRRTRLVSSSLVSFFNGFRIPLQPMLAAVRKHSPAMVALDVTQALGRIPVDLTDVDLIVCSSHKWILASHGGGLVGVPRRRAEQWTVPAGGWFNLSNAFDADRFERAVTKPGAASFTVGMPNFPVAYAVCAGLKYVHGIGVKAIDDHCRPLIEACYNGLQKLPVELITPESHESWAGIVAFRHSHSAQIVAALAQRSIFILHHAGRLRVSIHGYNNTRDIDRLLSAIHECLSR